MELSQLQALIVQLVATIGGIVIAIAPEWTTVEQVIIAAAGTLVGIAIQIVALLDRKTAAVVTPPKASSRK